MPKLSDLRITKNMKYTALYTAMRFFENKEDIFEKKYPDGTEIIIDAASQKVSSNGTELCKLTTPVSFVKLEFINRLLSLGYKTEDFVSVDENCLEFKNFRVQFLEWETPFDLAAISENEVQYKSRLVSGVLEYQNKIKTDDIYDYGLVEIKDDFNLKKKIQTSYNNPDFEIEGNRVIRYAGKTSKVIVPEGIEEIESSAFWDNQFIEEVELPETLVNMGGDTFYNCRNLRKVNIPSSVRLMGNNPFAGCPLIEVANFSSSYVMEDGALYTADKKQMIYCSIKGDSAEFVVPEGVEIIGKHTFFLCDRFTKITLPETLRKMENNPFSGCSKLSIENNSSAYFIKDDVIYNGFKTSVVGTLNKIVSDNLVLLEGIKTINRNSFWNCKGIKKIVLPESLEDIGYNPFVGCSNIHFESKSQNYIVDDGILYNKNMSKIICYPAWKAETDVYIPDSVTALERGAFSGCKNMTSINLHNVNVINKSCFTNCTSLKEIYISDLIGYIGEWAFGHCSSLEKVSVKEGTIIDNNAFSNCNASIEFRKEVSNYLFESDNKFTLQAMQKNYEGKIDSILIDPPYNSNIDYIGFKDGDYSEGYYNYMAERLQDSYKLLSDKGFLVINIDEGEVEGLSELCKKFFNEDLVSVHKWKKLHDYFDANRDTKPGKKSVLYEYIIICRKTEKAVFNKIMQPEIINGVIKDKISEVPEFFDCFGTTSSAKDELCEIFGRRDYFSTPKPVKLMKELIRATTDKDSIIMDYFAGSGTVGQACLELNKDDNGNRHFIMVCNKESNICEEVTNKRLEYASNKYNSSFVFMR